MTDKGHKAPGEGEEHGEMLWKAPGRGRIEGERVGKECGQR